MRTSPLRALFPPSPVLTSVVPCLLPHPQPPCPVIFSLFDRHNLLVACDPRYGRYLTAATIFRGQLSAQEVEISIEQLQSKNSSLFVEYVCASINPALSVFMIRIKVC